MVFASYGRYLGAHRLDWRGLPYVCRRGLMPHASYLGLVANDVVVCPD